MTGTERKDRGSGATRTGASTGGEMDLSQDLPTLRQLLGASQHSPLPLPPSAASESTDYGACDDFLAGLSEQWQRWSEQAEVEGAVESHEVDLRGGWQGLPQADGEHTERDRRSSGGREHGHSSVDMADFSDLMEEDERDDD